MKWKMTTNVIDKDLEGDSRELFGGIGPEICMERLRKTKRNTNQNSW
jgi:hypothetical protein